mmetsp:Transcript_28917/g.54243  ORF Transcript_28917/g.54243 Transcript_28917/m.54243 type:complete len:136 (+) Transcript_28917:79-486(+)
MLAKLLLACTMAQSLAESTATQASSAAAKAPSHVPVELKHNQSRAENFEQGLNLTNFPHASLRGGEPRSGWTSSAQCCSKYQVRTQSYEIAQHYLTWCLQISHCSGWTKEWLTQPGVILVYCSGGCEAAVPKSLP